MEQQFKRDWNHSIDKYKSDASINPAPPDFPPANSMDTLPSLLYGLLRTQKANAVRLRNAVPPVLNHLERILTMIPPVEDLVSVLGNHANHIPSPDVLSES